MKWYKLSEKMPVIDKEVLVAVNRNGGYVTVGEFMGAAEFRVLGKLGCIGHTVYIDIRLIVSWAEIPEFDFD